MSITLDGTNGVTSDASFYGKTTFTGTYTDGIVVDYTTGTGRITVGASDGFKIRNNGTSSPTDLVTVDSSGNVGVGTSSPSNKLTVYASSQYNGYSLKNASNTVAELLGFSASNDNGGLKLYSGGTSKVELRSDADSYLTGGNLLVGTTSFAAGQNSKKIQPDAIFSSRSTTGGDGHILFYNPNGVVGQIYTSGTSTTFATSSDYRLKENVQPMQNALVTVQQLRPVTYTWKTDGADGQGFIAHELQAIVPDCVTGEKDAVDADGNPVYQGIDTSFLVATLTAAIQELNAKVEAQALEIATLKNNLK